MDGTTDWLDKELAMIESVVGLYKKHRGDAESISRLELYQKQICRQVEHIREVNKALADLSPSAGSLCDFASRVAFFAGQMAAEVEIYKRIFGPARKLSALDANRKSILESRKVVEPTRCDVIAALTQARRAKPHAKSKAIVSDAGRIISIGRDRMYETIRRHGIKKNDWESRPGSVSHH